MSVAEVHQALLVLALGLGLTSATDSREDMDGKQQTRKTCKQPSQWPTAAAESALPRRVRAGHRPDVRRGKVRFWWVRTVGMEGERENGWEGSEIVPAAWLREEGRTSGAWVREEGGPVGENQRVVKGGGRSKIPAAWCARHALRQGRPQPWPGGQLEAGTGRMK